MPTYYRCSNGHVFSEPDDEANDAVSKIISTDLTPEQLERLDEIIDYYEPEESMYIKRLEELGFLSRANRAKDCGKYFRLFRHDAKNGQPAHTWKSPASRCMQRSCPLDAKVQAFEHVQKFLPVAQLIQTHFTHIEIQFPLANDDPGYTNSIVRALQRTLTKVLPHKGDPAKATLSKVGYRDEHMLLKALHCSAIDGPTRIRLVTAMAALGATVTTTECHKDLFVKILNSVMGMDIPVKDLARAEFEAAVAFTKQITSVGVPKQIVYDRSLHTNTVTVDHPTEPQLSVEIKVCRCPKCGQDPDYLSDWCTGSDSVEKIRNVRWQYKLPPPKTSTIN